MKNNEHKNKSKFYRASKAVLLLVSVTPFSCLVLSDEAGNVEEMFKNGGVSGNVRAHYYTRNNAFLVEGLNHDTASYGGSVKYTTAEYNGLSLGLSAIFARGIDHPESSHIVADLSRDQTNFGEAYIQYRDENVKITVGNQRMDLPFAGDYDYRITPTLYQGIYGRYGDSDDFLAAARIFRFMPQGLDTFSRRTMYDSPYDDSRSTGEDTGGMLAMGGGRSLLTHQNSIKWNSEAWYEKYYDYADLIYLESHVSSVSGRNRPFFGVQYFRGTGSGKEVLGRVDSVSYGAQVGLKRGSFKASVNYNHIESNPSAYLNGTLVTPYAENVVSSPYFAQPFFTNTKAGAGNVYSFDVSESVSKNIFVGGRYTFLDLKSDHQKASSNTTEYLAYGIYRFDGKLDGISVSYYGGMQSSPNSKKDYWESRFILDYSF